MTQQSNKNIILLVSGVADTFFSTNSHKQLQHTNELDSRIKSLIDQNKDKFFGYIDVLGPKDQRKDVNVFNGIRNQRIVNLRLNSTNLIDHTNELSVVQEDGSKMQLSGRDLDFVLRPEDYEIHICGVDLHGMYKTVLTELLEKGYNVTLYSDMLKRYKGTEDSIKSIRNRKFEYCSSRTALSK